MRVVLGTALRVLHFILAVIAFGLSLFGPLWLVPYLNVFWLGMLTMYVLNRGCVITHLERHLTGENYTIVDPFLQILGLPVTPANRNKITMMGGILMLLVGIVRMKMQK